MHSNNKMKTETRKSEISLNELVGVGVSLVIVGLVFVYGIDITKDIRDTDVTCPAHGEQGNFTYNASNGQCYNETGTQTSVTSEDFIVANNTMYAMGKIPEKLPTIAVILAVSVIIFVLMRAFAMKR